MTDPVEGLRKVLALERQKQFSDNAVVGGLDRYLLNFVREAGIPSTHRFSGVLRALPPGGYRALHVLQRRRVVEELLSAAGNGVSAAAGGPAAPSPAPAPAKPVRLPVAPPDSAQEPGRSAVSSASLVGTLDSPVTILPGISRVRQSSLANLGISTIRALLLHLPARYHDYSQIRPIAELSLGEEQTVIGDVWSVKANTIGRRKVTEALVSDKTGTIRALWWSGDYVAKRLLREHMRVALSGKITAFRNRLQIDNAEIETLDDQSLNTRRLVPVYPLTQGVEQRDLRRWVRDALDAFGSKFEETLPTPVLQRHSLPAISEAVRRVHFPESAEEAEAARHRFAFEELLQIELGVVRRRREWQAGGKAPALSLPPAMQRSFLASLPFALTAAQQKAMDAILADIQKPLPMSRLLEGDVGSGKTVVATAALLAAVAADHQGAIMAPTEILAEQHFRTLVQLLGGEGAPPPAGEGTWFQEGGAGFVVLRPAFLERPLRLALLKGSLRAADKTSAQEAIARGEVDIAVGTHALVQESVGFQRLGLVVVDEQHRFGVEQRAALREKGGSPHMLVMTATPIPRTLALTVYGDLDVTVLDEMPPGRPPVKTWRVTPQQRQSAYNFLKKKIAEGRQAYVIFPLVEESEAVTAKAAVQEYERLSRDLPELRLGLLHGRMPTAEKESIMRAFRDSEVDVLVSTAVVEVGIDVPNATVILIEGADRFGLSQLHQFRGRVRRSGEQAYCFLLSDNSSPDALERLQIMETVNDGFQLAEEDLRLRGPGEYFGTRQSGLPDLRAARLTDVQLIEETRAEATRLLEEDPELRRPEHQALRERLDALWSRVSGDVS